MVKTKDFRQIWKRRLVVILAVIFAYFLFSTVDLYMTSDTGGKPFFSGPIVYQKTYGNGFVEWTLFGYKLEKSPNEDGFTMSWFGVLPKKQLGLGNVAVVQEVVV